MGGMTIIGGSAATVGGCRKGLAVSGACARRLGLVVLLIALFPHLALAEEPVELSSLRELQKALTESDATFKLKPGNYKLTDLPKNRRALALTGSNNRIDLTGVKVEAPIGTTRGSYLIISGDGNVFKGGSFEDTYANGMTKVTDFGDYNQDQKKLAVGLRGSAVMKITGDDNKVLETKLTVRGSFPYGYGSIYGIGGRSTFGLDKRCGILIKGKNNVIDRCEVQMRSFGHGIYMQKPSDNALIKNTLVEGRLRPSKELYEETDPKDLPARSKYKAEGKDIPKDVFLPLSEDGIRVYNGGGSVTVENCTVKKMRGGIRLYMASEAVVRNSTAIDCGATNFNMPNNGKISGSSGNFTYAPLSDFRLSRSRQKIEMTILPSPQVEGPHHLADIQGSDHHIVLRQKEGSKPKEIRPIVVSGDRSTIINETEYPIILLPSANDNRVTSLGKVTDKGEDNKVKKLDPDKDLAESE